MKNKIIRLLALVLLAFFSIIHCSVAQKGAITYKLDLEPTINEIQQKLDTITGSTDKFAASMSLSAFEKAAKLSFLLQFNTTHSKYEKQEQLSEDIGMLEKVLISFLFDEGVYFIDLPKKKRFLQLEEDGQLVNIEEKFQAYRWEITKETANIAGYTCTKAIAKVKVMKAKDKNDLFGEKVEVENTYFAWFTKDIPVPFGPKAFHGLPGLVLKAGLEEDKATCVIATNIILGDKAFKEKKLALAKGEEKISRKEWDAFQDKKYKSTREMIKSHEGK